MLLRLPGTYRPQADTRLLTDTFVEQGLTSAERVLDVGTGTGAVALAAAHAGRGRARVTAVDVSRGAVWAARLNARVRGLSVTVHHGDLLAPVAHHTFDVILANPPYVPAPEENGTPRGAARAWDAGLDGRAVLDRLCAEAPPLLSPGGSILIVHSALCGAGATLGMLAGAGLRASVVARVREPFGPVLAARRKWLEREGLIEPGQRDEELVVIRGDRQE